MKCYLSFFTLLVLSLTSSAQEVPFQRTVTMNPDARHGVMYSVHARGHYPTIVTAMRVTVERDPDCYSIVARRYTRIGKRLVHDIYIVKTDTIPAYTGDLMRHIYQKQESTILPVESNMAMWLDYKSICKIVGWHDRFTY